MGGKACKPTMNRLITINWPTAPLCACLYFWKVSFSTLSPAFNFVLSNVLDAVIAIASQRSLYTCALYTKSPRNDVRGATMKIKIKITVTPIAFDFAFTKSSFWWVTWSLLLISRTKARWKTIETTTFCAVAFEMFNGSSVRGIFEVHT